MFDFGEFDSERLPMRRDGMTSVQVIAFLRAIRPEIPHWVCWEPHRRAVGGMVREADKDEGTLGAWRWRRVDCPYPALAYHDGVRILDRGVWRWTGLLEITAPEGGTFLLFSYLDSEGRVGTRFFVSTVSESLLERFQNDVADEAERTSSIQIAMANAESLLLDASAIEWILLPPQMQEDIETQVFTFFQNRAAYERMGVPYRRGLLFAGLPGCGKTLMVRRIVRECHKRSGTPAFSIRPSASCDADDLARLFQMAAERSPSLVILDDMDSLTKETHIPRAALLGELDGLHPHEGVLVIGTTNNPADIDPALAHRPSRFDRVWRFELPGAELRMEYFRHALGDIGRECLDDLVHRTRDWSYAYMNELRASAGILAIRDGSEAIGEKHLQQALHLLGAQFSSGRKWHASASSASVGFAEVEEEKVPA